MTTAIEEQPGTTTATMKTGLEQQELTHVFRVVERDEELRRQEQLRLKHLVNQLGLLGDDQIETISNTSSNITSTTMQSAIGIRLCSNCQVKFGILFNRRRECFLCKLPVCTECCVVIVKTGLKLRICQVCEKRRFVKERAFFWFYLTLRQRFQSAQFGADWLRHYRSSICCSVADAGVQTDLCVTSPEQMKDLHNLWARVVKDSELVEDHQIQSLREHCEVELIDDINSLRKEVKNLLKKIDPEEYDAINAISSCYKRRLASMLAQYTKMFYIVLLLAAAREQRVNQTKVPCENCAIEEHTHDEFCRDEELAYAARSVVETTATKALSYGDEAGRFTVPMTSPFSDQTIADVVIGDFEQQLAELLVDDAVKELFLDRLQSSSLPLEFTSGRIQLVTPMYPTPGNSTSSGRNSTRPDEGIHSDMSPETVCDRDTSSPEVDIDESLIASTRFSGRMDNCPRVGQSPEPIQEESEEDDKTEDDNVEEVVKEDNNDDENGDDHENENKEDLDLSEQELGTFARCSISPSGSTRLSKDYSLNFGDYSVRSDSTEFEAMYGRYSEHVQQRQKQPHEPTDLSLLETMELHSGNDSDDSFCFYTPDHTQIPVDRVAVAGGELAKFSLMIQSEVPITEVDWFSVEINPNTHEPTLRELDKSNGRYRMTTGPAQVSEELSKEEIAEHTVAAHLEIACVSTADNGRYLCKAMNVDGKSIARIMSLTVQQFKNRPPQFIVLPETTYHAYVGDKLSLLATVKAYPNAKLTWLKAEADANDAERVKVIELANNESELLFEQLELSDEAEYIVVATNEIGQCHAQTHVFVKEKNDQSRTFSIEYDSLGNDSLPEFISPPQHHATPYTKSTEKGKVTFKAPVKNRDVTFETPPSSAKKQNGPVTSPSLTNNSRLSVNELRKLFNSTVVSSTDSQNDEKSLPIATEKPTEKKDQITIDQRESEKHPKSESSFAGNPCCEDDHNTPPKINYHLANSSYTTLGKSETGQIEFRRESRHVIFNHDYDRK